MKLLKQFKNRYDNITYKIYETDNGVKVLHLDNPATINFDLAVIHAAGAAFEIQEDVPRGTAHFLEHMLLNPNSYFRTQDDINRFEQGSKERPALDINAFTNKKNIIFEGHSHQKGALRIIDRFEKIYDFPKKKFSNLLEKERGIILAEKSRKLKKKSNASIMYMEHMFKGIADEFTGDTLGEEEDIKAITINDLEKYYLNRILDSNAVISIQSNGALSKRMIVKIESFSKRLTFSHTLGIRDIKLKNEWKIGVFQDKREN
ncbi:insulinase family protein, partial [Candidatus Dojkabacteria bacterium]|nr:insulinase family protein [Candidatus Dojkabacteria bacterium]